MTEVAPLSADGLAPTKGLDDERPSPISPLDPSRVVPAVIAVASPRFSVSARKRRGGRYIECSKCHDRIHSEHRHDFRWCRCRETFVDGGADYLRCGGFPLMTVEGQIATFEGVSR